MPGLRLPVARVEKSILLVRRQRVLLDEQLAALFGTTTSRVNEQVKRNRDRFPGDFMFRLTMREWTRLRSQSATANIGRGGRRSPPYAFTEHGAVMLANVLNSRRAVQVSIVVVRTFIRIRQLLMADQDLARRLDELERRYEDRFRVVFEAIRELMAPPEEPRKSRIGFVRD